MLVFSVVWMVRVSVGNPCPESLTLGMIGPVSITSSSWNPDPILPLSTPTGTNWTTYTSKHRLWDCVECKRAKCGLGSGYDSNMQLSKPYENKLATTFVVIEWVVLTLLWFYTLLHFTGRLPKGNWQLYCWLKSFEETMKYDCQSLLPMEPLIDQVYKPQVYCTLLTVDNLPAKHSTLHCLHRWIVLIP